MRIAFVGKGGSGKSTLAGTFARLLARSGELVLVLDSDPMPGVAWTLGLTPTDAGIPDEATEEGPDGGPRWRLRSELTPAEAVERFALRGPDGVRFLQFGKLHGHVGGLHRSQHAFSNISKGLDDGPYHLVGDLPAGTRQPFFGWASYAQVFLVVVEPTVKSVMSARRLAKMADPTGRKPGAHTPEVLAVVNKATTTDDAAALARRTGLEVVGVVPADDTLAQVERDGGAPIDIAPDSPAVRAVASLLAELRRRERALQEDAS